MEKKEEYTLQEQGYTKALELMKELIQTEVETVYMLSKKYPGAEKDGALRALDRLLYAVKKVDAYRGVRGLDGLFARD